MTIEKYTGEIIALTEQDDYKNALQDDNVANWIWQFAESAKQAISQHITKHDEWYNDINNGKEEKHTY